MFFVYVFIWYWYDVNLLSWLRWLVWSYSFRTAYMTIPEAWWWCVCVLHLGLHHDVLVGLCWVTNKLVTSNAIVYQIKLFWSMRVNAQMYLKYAKNKHCIYIFKFIELSWQWILATFRMFIFWFKQHNCWRISNAKHDSTQAIVFTKMLFMYKMKE